MERLHSTEIWRFYCYIPESFQNWVQHCLRYCLVGPPQSCVSSSAKDASSKSNAYVTFSIAKGVFDVFDRLYIDLSSSNSDPGITCMDVLNPKEMSMFGQSNQVGLLIQFGYNRAK